MSSDRLPVRVFVLTATGEQGPLETPDIASLVVQGVIQTSDMVRSASGRNLGTVGGILAAAGQDSGVAPAIPASRESDRRRRQQAAPPAGGPGRWLVTGLIIVAVVGGLAFATSAGRPVAVAGSAAPPVAADPEITLTQAAMGDGFTELRLDAAQPLAATVVVQVRQTDDERTVRMEPADGRVVLRAGSASGLFRLLVSGDRLGQYRGQVAVVAGQGYRIASAPPLQVRVERRPPPGIAWEPGVYRDQAAARAGGGSGWSGGWDNGDALVRPTALVPPVGSPGPPGHLLHLGLEYGQSIRVLAQRRHAGVVWISCIVQGERHPDGALDWASLALADGPQWMANLGIGNRGTTMWITRNQEDQALQQSTQVAYQIDCLVPTRVVWRVQMDASASALSCWLDPPGADEPQQADAQHRGQLPRMTFDRVVISRTRGGIRVADLRFGHTWQEVLPLR